ncbi:MAG: AsmA family protein [Gammaproteobacteria bacterium]|nr:AsmA family protein [Gammaproteobacteria bacterium]
MLPSGRAITALKWTGIVIGGLLVLVLIAAALLDANANALRGPLARMASARLGRAVHLDGRLELHLLSFTPSVVVRQLRIANPTWATQAGGPDSAASREAGPSSPRQQADMARIGELKLSLSIPALFKGDVVLPYVETQDTDVNLWRDASKRMNWQFTQSEGAKSKQPAKLPIVRSLHLGPGHLMVRDDIRKLHFSGTVTASQAKAGGAQSLGLNGNGDINGASFQLTASGDPLITAEHHKPYTLISDIRAGGTRVNVRVTIQKPFDMGSLVADISSSGDDLADLYYLTGLALPNTAPYTVSGHLQRSGTSLKLTRFEGTLGKSDIHGTMSIETATERPLLTADLATRLLDIRDLAPTLGARSKSGAASLSHQQSRAQKPEDSTAKARAAAPNAVQTPAARAVARSGKTKPSSASEKKVADATAGDTRAARGETLLPDAKLDLQRIRGMDANVKYRAESVKTQKLSIREIALSLKLDHGVMTFEPLAFQLPQGKLVSNIRVDGTKDVPAVKIDTHITSVRLSELHGKDTPPAQAPLDGIMVGRAILHGRGKSVHEVGATADGTVSVVVPHGEIREALAELTGINAARGLGLLLSKNQDKANIRCGVDDFKAAGGVFAAQENVIDTDNVLITGKGEIDLGQEIIDITLNGQPKKPRLFRIKALVALEGTLSKPKVGVKPGSTPAQAAAATALGVLATPLAAALAFIDPGLAKDADCGSLLAEAQRHGAPVKAAAPTKEGAGKDRPDREAQRSTKARSIT